MNNEKKKCEDIGFVHAWKDITENIVYATYPPSYPPRERRCLNCGKIEKLITKQEEVKEWVNTTPNNLYQREV